MKMYKNSIMNNKPDNIKANIKKNVPATTSLIVTLCADNLSNKHVGFVIDHLSNSRLLIPFSDKLANLFKTTNYKL